MPLLWPTSSDLLVWGPGFPNEPSYGMGVECTKDPTGTTFQRLLRLWVWVVQSYRGKCSPEATLEAQEWAKSLSTLNLQEGVSARLFNRGLGMTRLRHSSPPNPPLSFLIYLLRDKMWLFLIIINLKERFMLATCIPCKHFLGNQRSRLTRKPVHELVETS